MSCFNLPGFSDPVPVTLTENLSEEKLLDFPAFKTWIETLKTSLADQKKRKHPFHKFPYTLRSITIQSVDFFGSRIGFVKLKAEITNDATPPQTLPGVAFLRGGSVAVLIILRPKDSRDERWVVMTLQPRIPAGSLSFMEIPAGMVDKHKNFAGAAATEIKEETGLEIPQKELIDMTELALENTQAPERKQLQSAMYPSPGGSDEFIPLFLWEKELDRQEIEDLRGRLTGLRTQGEMITLKLCNYEELWREGARDAKTLAAWALYEALKRAGKLP